MRKAIAFILALLVIGIAAVMIILKKKGVVIDSAQVEASAAQMLPGARPPGGLKGVLSLKLQDLQVAIFAPSLGKAEVANLSGDDLRIIIAKPTTDQRPQPQEVLQKISQAQNRKAEEMDTLEKSPTLLKVGGKPYPAIESKTMLKSNGTRLRENLTVLLVEKRPVIVLICGPEATFNSATRDQFLAGLSVTAGPPSDMLPVGTPTPEAPPIGRPGGRRTERPRPGRRPGPPGPPGGPPGPPGPP